MKVKAKKHLGQHFLKNPEISKRIADAIDAELEIKSVIEVGPGTGALTRPLRERFPENLYLMEVDVESIQYQVAIDAFPKPRIFNQDFLKADLSSFEAPIVVTGNFPYNISSQIVFKVIEDRDKVNQLVGMFQKEVAERICSGPGSKVYGIISVLTQLYFDCEYLFTVGEDEFDPPPKVKSGVLRMVRREGGSQIKTSDKFFWRVVKAGFNLRRKTLRNSLKSMMPEGFTHQLLSQRPEQLSIAEFDDLAFSLEKAM